MKNLPKMFAISILTNLCTLSLVLARFSLVPPVQENYNGNSELGLFRMEPDGQRIGDAENKGGDLDLLRRSVGQGIGDVKNKREMDHFVEVKQAIIRALSKHLQALTGNPSASDNSEDKDNKRKQVLLFCNFYLKTVANL